MTKSLDAYLRGPYKDDNTFLKTLRNKIEEVIPIFYKESARLLITKDSETRVVTWPYAVSFEGKLTRRADYFSPSTHCMILFALDALTSREPETNSVLTGRGFRPTKLSPETGKRVLGKVNEAKKSLVRVLSRRQPRKNIVWSGTYGRNDPFTLTWLTEIARRMPDLSDATKRKISAAVTQVLKRNDILDTADTVGTFREVTGSFLKVRRLHLAKSAACLQGYRCAKTARKWIEDKMPDLWNDFDDTIHRQLSFFSMGDPKFDPAELAFAFEGALLLHPSWLSDSVINEVFDSLTLSQERQPFWRPITPFLANDRGQVLFLVSIEVANSILRACEILDEDEPVPARFARIEAQLRIYATWVRGEIQEIPDPNTETENLFGWRTEYSDKRETIHLWHTSHVLLFLAHYESFLRRKIGADAIDAAGLNIRQPKKNDQYWKDEPLRGLAKKGQPQYAVLARIHSQYIQPRLNGTAGEDAPRSMLLYGPPGTGKTTVAEQVAAALNRPLIVITVSDFLAEGGTEIENRAKGVFEVLRAQEDVVVLFDEIDQFLLDRNSKLYNDQSDIFKFLTPGMLTKLQDLRDAEGCIFILATNYYERIDSAIKRSGRIDEKFLLCLPDAKQRQELLLRFALKFFKSKRKTKHQIASHKKHLKSIMADKLLRQKTCLLGYGDLKNLVEQKAGLMPETDIPAIKVGLLNAEVDPATNLSAYNNRFQRFRPDGGPYPLEEFFLLVYLLAESNKMSDGDEEMINRVLGVKRDTQTFQSFFEKEIKDEFVCGTLRNLARKLLQSAKSRSKKRASKTR
jgi:adenylate kinase family enzyme